MYRVSAPRSDAMNRMSTVANEKATAKGTSTTSKVDPRGSPNFSGSSTFSTELRRQPLSELRVLRRTSEDRHPLGTSVPKDTPKDIPEDLSSMKKDEIEI